MENEHETREKKNAIIRRLYVFYRGIPIDKSHEKNIQNITTPVKTRVYK